MALFGDRDVKTIKTEITAFRLAVGMRHRADPRHFAQGTASAIEDVIAAGRRLQAKGRGDEVAALLARLTADSTMSGEDQAHFLEAVTRIRAGLGLDAERP